MPKLSVCIPAYKEPDLLEKALRALETQTFRDFELILTDDTPDDSVRKLAERWQDRLPITYQSHRPSLGTPENWNAGLRLAQGEYVLVHHHDDWLLRPDSLALFVKALDDQPEAVFAFANTDIRRLETDERIRLNRPSEKQLEQLKTEPEVLITADFVGVPSTVMFRKSTGIFFDSQLKWLVDVDFYVRCLRYCPVAAYIPEALVGVAIHEKQVTASVTKNKNLLLFEYFTVAEKFGIDLRREPYAGAYGYWCWRLKVKSVDEIRKAGYVGPLPKGTEAVIRSSWKYGMRHRYIKLVMFVKYRILKLKRKDLHE
ncbi:glycosyltransferase family 2 protein [Siphonobacter sp. SORGH_AS_0500]|uniref:glycosyltransferase family 2 protein n=1 Tax=Siphonobacter sp. SORGH_AS_0500 TaxID=1864824 RepID=UPI002862BE84|nr:glycosyltransferase family 2 protein [Siphonobacter sp. SORGH_AS_0500]MDR6196032.1 glycosyltransferase involved in cell wall biosynthesis [Siphonobacter sp. SORGH_AS_0500]